MTSLPRSLATLLRVLAHAPGVPSDVARTGRMMREANRLEATSPQAAAALRAAAREVVLA
jgi:hypothetical protein